MLGEERWLPLATASKPYASNPNSTAHGATVVDCHLCSIQRHLEFTKHMSKIVYGSLHHTSFWGLKNMVGRGRTQKKPWPQQVENVRLTAQQTCSTFSCKDCWSPIPAIQNRRPANLLPYVALTHNFFRENFEGPFPNAPIHSSLQTEGNAFSLQLRSKTHLISHLSNKSAS